MTFCKLKVCSGYYCPSLYEGTALRFCLTLYFSCVDKVGEVLQLVRAISVAIWRSVGVKF